MPDYLPGLFEETPQLEYTLLTFYVITCLYLSVLVEYFQAGIAADQLKALAHVKATLVCILYACNVANF